MGKVTKRVTLQRCIDLWDWLAAHPTCWKGSALDTFPWLKECEAYCPCCEYCEKHNVGCQDCPMNGRWESETEDKRYSHCLNDGALFRKWEDTPVTSKKKRATLAIKIANAARAALAALPAPRRK